MSETHLTSRELAARLNVNDVTLRGWRMKGGGPAYIKLGRAVRYPLRLVVEWEASRTVKSDPTREWRKPIRPRWIDA